MAEYSMSTDLDVSADEAWKLIGGFNALPDWHPAVEKSELTGQGQTRTLSLAGGGTITEKLERISDEEREYTYSITDSPLPVANYKATIRVKDADGGCTVEWSSAYEPVGAPEDASKVIEGIYQAGLDNLKKMFGG